MPLPALREYLAGRWVREGVLCALALHYLARDSQPATREQLLPDVDVEKVRAFVRETVDASSLRRVVAEIGQPVTRNSLSLFVRGGRAPLRTLVHLVAWHTRQFAENAHGQRSDWREIDVGTLRRYFAGEVEIASWKAVARATRISVATLQRFVGGEVRTRQRVLRSLALLYLARQGRRSAPMNARRLPAQRKADPDPCHPPRRKDIDAIVSRGIDPTTCPLAPCSPRSAHPWGVGPLFRFLGGGTPVRGTLEHLMDWYDRTFKPESMSQQDWKSVPVPALRAYYAAEVAQVGSREAVALAAGVSDSALQRFLAVKGTSASRVLRRLALQYLNRGGRLSPAPPRRRRRVANSPSAGADTSPCSAP